MPLVLSDLKDENALVVVGTMGRLLRRLDREAGTDLAEPYQAEATAGDYDHLLEVTERYAVDHLATTLHAHAGDLTGGRGYPDDREGDPDVCDHCGCATTPMQERECDDCTARILGTG